MKISLKIKILLGVSLLLVICTGLNLGYSYMLFTEDKTSYVLDSELKNAINISDEINFIMDDFPTKAKFTYNLLNNPSNNFDNVIKGQRDVVAAGFISLDDVATDKDDRVYTNEKKLEIYKKDNPELFTEITKDIILKINIDTGKKNEKEGLALDADFDLDNEAVNGKMWIYTSRPLSGKEQRFLIYCSGVTINKNWFYLILDLNPILDQFYKDLTYTNKVLSISEPKDKTFLEDELGLVINTDISYDKSKKGTSETKHKFKNREDDVFVSYSFVNKNILVISYINKDSAFAVIDFIMKKIFLFGVFLLSLGLVAGIYFSSSITYPIIILTDKAKKVASGDFESDVQIKTTDEIKILGDTFNFMSHEIKALLSNKEDLIAKLENYSKNLEKMVEQRTIELKDANNFMALMMNSLDQGFLVFDDELLCNPMFTKACEPIFGVSPFGKTIIDVLNVTDEGNAQNLRQWAKVLFSEMIPFESAIDLGPREKVTGNSYTDENYKYVNIDYYPMRDSDEKISNVVMIATDKTNEVQAREIAKEKESYVYMILKILNNKTQFESFVNEVEGIFHQFNKVYSIEDGTIDFNLCMMLFHTLNGGFGIYSINKIQQIAREYETGISNIKDTNPNLLEYIPVLDGQVEHLRNEFLNFRIELDKLVGTKFASNQSLSEIPRYKILEFKELVAQSENIDLRNYFDENFLKVPIIDYFKAYDDLCITTAAKINKQFLGLTFHNSELKIEAESLLEFFNVLVHLFRNCLDHGLEEASTRLSLGKTAEGHIEVSFNEIENFDKKILSVIIQDDGAGINPEIIRARCEKLNPSEDISGLSDKEVIYQIFAPFFSTRDEVSALSGRGVGMSAIKEVVDRLQGEIEINSQVGVGTVFSFSIPIS